jgi:hypothetical protein
MNNRVQQQTQRIYENMALLALDLFARIISSWTDLGAVSGLPTPRPIGNSQSPMPLSNSSTSTLQSE